MDLSPTGQGRVLLGTVLGTIGCVAVALFLAAVNHATLEPARLLHAAATDIVVSVLLAAPILYVLLSKLRQLASAHRLLRRHADTDGLTALLNRAAFTREVDEELADARFAPDGMRGALLVVDVDNLKDINDSFGHEHGDAALQLIAGILQGALRAADRVGRIAGEEFAVFLPGASQLIAEAVAERLRLAVLAAEFRPDNRRRQLTVSIGGAVYDRYLPLAELFRLADQQLYAAKQNGRNCSAVSSIAHYETLPATAA
ncbi:MAG: GGDEF domain-containing protein [Devosia sp.]|uniref:GGDEF domain-containing protein n=1 Tax=Devosia sp. TaxID=1871048 RepID=UPI001ACE3FAF|nr:GGDEF domain-containing protein [Devosia sp.]MBN9317847.1 GGDEF domain-containing protein [Devosia sp.]